MSTTRPIPPSLEKLLVASRRRIRRILLVRGLCSTLAAFVAAMLGVMAVDAMVTIYAAWIRWLLSCAAAVGVGVVAWSALVRPLRRTFTLAEIAALIERNHPELEERLSTVVELAAAPDAETVGSEALIAAITDAAVRDIDLVSPKREFTARTVKPRLLAAALVILVLAALFAAFPSATARLVTRALLPSAEVDNVYASSLRVAPGDKTVLAGSSVEVNLAVESGYPSRAFVRTSVGGRREAVERMTRTTEEEAKGPAYYTFAYPSVDESFTYRVSCGNALTRSYRIDVVPMPTYDGRAVTIEHPAYTGRPADTYTNSADIVGLAGSRVTVRAKKSRPDVAGAVEFADGRRVASGCEPSETDLAFSFTLEPKLAGPWRGCVLDSHGFSNVVETATVKVAKDAPPTVKLLQPEKAEIKVPRTSILPMAFAAEDDFGIARRTVEICVGAGAWQDLQDVDGDAVSLSVSTLPLGTAAAFRLRVRVEDNLPADLGGPNIARTGEVLVEIQAHGGTSLARQELREEIAEKKKKGEEIRRHLERAKQSIEQVKGYDGKDWQVANAEKNLEKAKEEAAQAEAKLAEFVEELRDSRLATGVEMFKPVLEDKVVPMREKVEDIYQVEPKAERAKAAAKAEQDAKAALASFNDAMRKLDVLGKTAEDMQKLEDLAERGEALAEAAKNETMDAEKLAKAEQDVARELADELRDDMAKNFDQEKRKADALAKRAQELGKRQEEIQGMQGEEQRKAEEKLSHDVQRLANETGDLKSQIENRAGTPEMDATKTSQPVRDAQRYEQEAANHAHEAAANMKDAKGEEAKDNMDAVQKALADAGQSFAEVNAKLDAKAQEMAENAATLKDQLHAVQDAAKSAQDAAKAEQEAAKSAQEAAKAAQSKDAAQSAQTQDESQSPPSQEAAQPSQESSEAQSSQQNAEKGMSPMAQSFQKAAQAMRQMVQQQMERANMPAEQFMPPENQQGESDGPADPNAKPNDRNMMPQRARPYRGPKGKIEDALKADTGVDWFRLKGEKSADAEADALDDVPAEYRNLVRDYFKALNEGDGK